MITGRKKELHNLEKIFKSKESEFVTIYGRRRIGKTYLIREFFENKECTFFHTTGIQDGSMQLQLKTFSESLSKAFLKGIPISVPKNWHDAFRFLNQTIEKTEGKVVIFLDELPWLATQKSGLMTSLAYYWNEHWSHMSKVILVVCGSAASWLIKKVIYNKGGLHNRTSLEIALKPFSLGETQDYLKSRDITLNEKHILEIYMALGGIPYYLKQLDTGLTAQENIQLLFFEEEAPLVDEFNKLFDSLFDEAEAYKEIIEILSSKKEGVERSEIADKAELSTDGGTLTTRLDELKATGFIRKFKPRNKEYGIYYTVIDEFCLFYLTWVKPNLDEDFIENFWIKQAITPAYHSWAGYAFEAVCKKHTKQIMRALNIPAAISSNSWRFKANELHKDGAQIDLVIDRSDNAITLCEMKYTKDPFTIDKNYANALIRKHTLFKLATKTDKQLFFSMVSASGLKKNAYSDQMITKCATLTDLFK